MANAAAKNATGGAKDPKAVAKDAKAKAKAAKKAEKARKKASNDPKDMGRIRQIIRAYQVTHEYDRALPYLLIGAFLLPIVLGIVVGLLWGRPPAGGRNYLVQFAAWTVAWAPGILAMLVGRSWRRL